MKTKYFYTLFKRIRLDRPIFLAAIVSLSAILAACAAPLNTTSSNNPGDQAVQPQPKSLSQSEDVAAIGDATIIVNSTADSVNPSDGWCTLREAIRAANSNTASGTVSGECSAGSSTGTDAIKFSVSDTVKLLSALPDITSAMTVDSNGQSVTISGDGKWRVFRVLATGMLNLQALTIINGVGGPDGSGGGGILNRGGVITISNTKFENNRADLVGGPGGADGGAISNREKDTGGRGGIVTIDNSTFTSNTAGGQGGAIFSGASLIPNSGNCNAQLSTVKVNNSTFTVNLAGTRGGGITINQCSTATVTSSTFDRNRAERLSGGGIENTGVVTVGNSTFFGNRAASGGGGIRNGSGGELTVINSTFSGNSAAPLRPNCCGGGAIKNGTNTRLILKNTILANSPSGGNCAGIIGDGGGNLSWPNDNTCPGIHQDPKLGPLQNNGGPTDTMELLPGSGAIDAGRDDICAAPPINNLDQRGITRPQGPHCDIGAYESGANTADLSADKFNLLGGVFPGQQAPYSINIHNGGSFTVVDARVTDNFPPEFIVSDWDCRTTPGSSCGVPSGTGNINTTVTLAPDGFAFFTVRGQVAPDATGTLSNTACVAPPSGITDPDSSNNCSTDDDPIQPPPQAFITLVKDVTNDNGGTAVRTDWTLVATGPAPLQIIACSGQGEASCNVSAGTYTLSESGPSGYIPGSWSCEKNGGAPVTGSSITLGVGDSAICTIINDDQTAHLKLHKEVTNDNGGTATCSDFTLSAAGPTPISGQCEVESDVNAGTYNLSETGPSDYNASDWVCEGGNQIDGDTVEIRLDGDVTCIITNDDQQQQAFITVFKDVTNDDGGSAAPDDFKLTLDGNPVLSGVPVPVNPGVHTAGETLLPGYTFEGFSGDCDSNGNVTVAAGENKTCTLTNNDIPAPPIKVTGGGQIPVPDPTSHGKATFGFNADQIEAGSTAATGHFNYVNHDTGLHINGSVNEIQVIATNPDGSPKTVQFSGTCDGNGPACTFIVTVEDHGEPGTSDEFGVTVTGDVSESQSQRVISKGNIQFHVR